MPRLLLRMRCRLTGGHTRGGEVLERVGSLILARCARCGVPIFEHTAMGSFVINEDDARKTAAEMRVMREDRLVL